MQPTVSCEVAINEKAAYEIEVGTTPYGISQQTSHLQTLNKFNSKQVPNSN